ncbi:hypothetical protein OROHE_009741 [Orobanche hederae]
MDVPEDLEDRPTIFTVGVIIKANFEDAWPTWRKVPQSMRDLYRDKFKINILNGFCREKFGYIVHGVRLALIGLETYLAPPERRQKRFWAQKKCKDWIDLNPEWMNSTIWNKLIKDFWSKKEWQNKFDSGTKNHLGGDDKASPTYTCGSIPISAHEIRMRKEFKYNPIELELFDRTHKTDGEYVCPKAKKVQEIYEIIVEEKYLDPESRSNFDVIAWKDASGRYKRRLYGFGNTRQNLDYERDGADVT